MLLNCGVGEDSWESLGCKEIQPVHSKGISPVYSLEGLMLKLKLQYFGHLMQRTNSLEKTLMLGKIEGKRRRGRQRINGWMAYRCNGHEFEQSSGVCDRQGSLVCLCPWGHKELDTTEQLNWTKLQQQRIQTLFFFSFFFFFLSPLWFLSSVFYSFLFFFKNIFYLIF